MILLATLKEEGLALCTMAALCSELELELVNVSALDGKEETAPPRVLPVASARGTVPASEPGGGVDERDELGPSAISAEGKVIETS